MKIKLSELRKLVREGIKMVKEDYQVDADGDIDLDNLPVRLNNVYGMDDQETMNRVANQRINLNPVADKDNDEVDLVLKRLLMSNEGKKSKKQSKDNYGNPCDWSISRYAKDANAKMKNK